MFTHFSKAEAQVHYPADRRVIVAMKPYVWLITGLLILCVVGLAWFQFLYFGMPSDPSAQFPPISADQPVGFPVWVSVSHWVNFFFLILLFRSGLSILMDHPRLYWDTGCNPRKQWIRFTPINIPKSKSWTAKEDARYISPMLSLPGYKHTIGIARIWHFLTVPFFLINGVIFVLLLFYTNQWMRLIPTSWQIFPDSWKVFVHYATFHFPVEPNGFYHFNALQKLSYFCVVFVMAPLAMLTGMAMSPAITNRFQWYPKLFGNRQIARSIHFLIMIAYAIFIVIHVSLVAATGFVRNMNHITVGTDDAQSLVGLYIGGGILLFVTLFCFLAHWLSWNRQRVLQALQAAINGTLWRLTINILKPRSFYTRKDISSYFWPNGKMPDSEEWKGLAKNDFRDYRLKIGGLVENPVELSLEELKNLQMEQNITMHNCIQGWSGIAEWGGVSMKAIVELVKPEASVTTVAFYSFGEGLYGGIYYDTHTLDNCLKPQSILAWEMNYEPLSLLHGAPIRLRVENQLGYKMVKWISSIEFLESHKNIGKGYGGKNEDDEYFDLLADT